MYACACVLVACVLVCLLGRCRSYNGISPLLEDLKWYGQKGKGLSEDTPYYYSPFSEYAKGKEKR